VSPGQWVCDHAVTPLTVTEVRVDDHARLLRYAMEQEKARYGLGDSAGYEPLAQYIPPTDGTVAARLRAAGAVILGKTNVPVLLGDIQTDNPIFGRTNYPWNIDRTPEGPAAVLRRRLLPDSYLWR